MQTINANKCCGIDIHAHVVPATLPTYIGDRLPIAWPFMVAAHQCHRHVVIADKVYRTVSDKCWDVEKRLADMPGLGLGIQVLSPMPELLSYWMDARDAQQILRYLNEQIGAMVAAQPAQLLGLGAVPLQDVDLAIDELRFIMQTPGLVGVELGSNINGVAIGDTRFDPFFEACVDLGAAVFVHALKPTGMDRLLGPGPLQQVLAYPTDVGLAAASCITTNLMARHPRLRIAFSHGGGTLASLLPRLEQGWQVFPALREAITESPMAQARKFHFDTLVFDTPTLRHLVALFGASQLMVGTDYPFNFHDRTPLQRIRAAGFEEATTSALAHANAERFLGLEVHQ
ncbi:amidohydrolase [Pseudomonas sp. CM25]|uniref:amidohydrolase family protein n=1 Tax=Pseudomonas sp. CM25 TaxID=2738448 RepID=UPI0015534374|nr:amidohydrolase family protein [Pseudomonas sp. CM25]NQD55672.1 amidohydrolase [Pseudomonas sp. CM25]